MRIPITDAQAKLCEIGKTLLAHDFTETVVLVTHDSIQVFDHALAKRYGEWLLLWTEHHGYHLEHEDEILHLRVVKESMRFSELPDVV